MREKQSGEEGFRQGKVGEEKGTKLKSDEEKKGGTGPKEGELTQDELGV